jgi:hypothetical protein
MVFIKALGKTLFHFFFGLGVCVSKKNESVFCALAKNFKLFFCAVAVFKIFIFCGCLSVQSGGGYCYQ